MKIRGNSAHPGKRGVSIELFFAPSAGASGDTGRFGTDSPKLYACSSSSSRQMPAFSIIWTTHSGVATAWGTVYILPDPPPCRSISAEQQSQLPTLLQPTASAPSQADQHDYQRQQVRNVFHRQDRHCSSRDHFRRLSDRSRPDQRTLCQGSVCQIGSCHQERQALRLVDLVRYASSLWLGLRCWSIGCCHRFPRVQKALRKLLRRRQTMGHPSPLAISLERSIHHWTSLWRVRGGSIR